MAVPVWLAQTMMSLFCFPLKCLQLLDTFLGNLMQVLVVSSLLMNVQSFKAPMTSPVLDFVNDTEMAVKGRDNRVNCREV